MENSFSANLRRIRKEKGITQEQLAERVGVSPQAVSKWEISSYPDAQLLPIISDSLGVTIDELYGGKRAEEIDIKERIVEYFASLPREKLFPEMTEICLAFSMACCGTRRYVPLEDHILYGKEQETYSQIYWNEGFFLSRLNGNLPFVWILPKPTTGESFDDVLAYDPKMAEMFRFLSLPNALRVLYFLTGRKGSMFFNRKTLMTELSITEENAAQIIDEMLSFELIWCAELNSGDTGEMIYQYVADCYFVSFLALARTLLKQPRCYYYGDKEREEPFFTEDSYRADRSSRAERHTCN